MIVGEGHDRQSRDGQTGFAGRFLRIDEERRDSGVGGGFSPSPITRAPPPPAPIVFAIASVSRENQRFPAGSLVRKNPPSGSLMRRSPVTFVVSDGSGRQFAGSLRSAGRNLLLMIITSSS